MTTSNKEVIRQLYSQVFNEGKFGSLNEIVAASYTSPQGVKGPNALIQTIQQLKAAFPDAKWTIEEILGDGEKVMIRQLFTGTHTGDVFQHIPPGNQKVAARGTAFYEFADHRIIRSEILTDRLGLLQQLRAIPTDLSVFTSPGQVSFIDKFAMPVSSLAPFMEKVTSNRNLVRQQEGWISDRVFQRTLDDGSCEIVTVAIWASLAALDTAKEVVRQEYQRIGFDLPDFLKSFQITMERGIFTCAE